MPEPPQKETDIARRIRAHGLARGQSPVEIAGEIYDQCGPLFGTSRVKSHRLARGVALSDVIAQVRALHEIDGKAVPKLGETLLSAYESSSKKPGPAYLHYLCLVYRAEPQELGFAGPCICGHEHVKRSGVAPLRRSDSDIALVGSIVAHPRLDRQMIVPDDFRSLHRAEGSSQGPGSTELGEEDIVLRRHLLQLLAGAGVTATAPLDGQLIGAIDGLRRRMDDTLVSATVSPTMLDQWEETILGYGQQYQNTPSLRMLCDVLLDFSEIRRMCDQRQPVELQERLCRIASQLSGMSGLIMINLGDHRLARSFFRTARTAADETGDRSLRAWVTARESLVPMYYGDPREALHLARKAQDLAGRTPCAAAAMAPAVEARALGMLALRGRTDAGPSARRALVRGRSIFEQLKQDDVSDLAYGFTERQLAFYEGDTYTNLGDHQRGEEALSRALTLYTSTDRLDRTLVRLDRATCRLHAGEPEAALAAGQEAIYDLPPEHRSDILMHRARQLGVAAAAKHGEIMAVRDYREALSAANGVQSPTIVPPSGETI